MARMTQYIGLTDDARAFLRGMTEERISLTEGMFGEEVRGGFWNKRYAEKVQCEPWNGGPMIFTYLQDIETGEKLFEWTYERELQGEVNRALGTYHV